MASQRLLHRLSAGHQAPVHRVGGGRGAPSHHRVPGVRPRGPDRVRVKREIPKPSIPELWESYGGAFLTGDRGGWRRATCVLHEDATPSASVNEEECKWHCYTCDKGGDAIDLIMEKED